MTDEEVKALFNRIFDGLKDGVVDQEFKFIMYTGDAFEEVKIKIGPNNEE